MLKHAMSFRSVKRIAYSTCSVHEQENEQVVRAVMNDEWQLVTALPQWPRRGHGMPEAIRTDAQQDLTNGFFVAVFERRHTMDE